MAGKNKGGALAELFAYAPDEAVIKALSPEYVLTLAAGVLRGCSTAEEVAALAEGFRDAIPLDLAADRIAQAPKDEALGALSAEYVLELSEYVLGRSSQVDVAAFIDEVRANAGGALIDPDEVLAAMAEGRLDDAAAMLEPDALRNWRGHVQVAELLRRAW